MPQLDRTIDQYQRQSEERSTQKLAASLGVGYTVLDDYPFSLEALRFIPLETVKARRYAIFLRMGTKVRAAIVEPNRKEIIDELTILSKQRGIDIEVIAVSESSLEHLIGEYERLLDEERIELVARSEAAKQEAQHNYFTRIRNLEDLRTQISSISITEALDAIIAAAYNEGASDIHLEPSEEILGVRFRIDGVLQRVLELPARMHHQLVSRLRVMANMKLDLDSATQDGRFSMREKGINADVRISIVPTGYGPGVVMRILRQDMRTESLGELGFSDYNLQLIQSKIHRPYGMIVVTGPTGSGKSTTLYSILSELNSSEKKILTLEDPIEYRLPGVQQSQVNPDKGYTFAEALRGALRQDPDVVMVGEIRDPETATIALNASLTGHLVLTTLHTNDALTAHTRFLELGVEPFLLNGSIQMIIAQRLVRKVVGNKTDGSPQYRGRVVIAEVLCPNQELEQAVQRHTDSASLLEIAKRGGMIPMLQDGMVKVQQGTTTESEVLRVTA